MLLNCETSSITTIKIKKIRNGETITFSIVDLSGYENPTAVAGNSSFKNIVRFGSNVRFIFFNFLLFFI